MSLSDLIEGLARPDSYPIPVDTVEVRQTHISAVFLAGRYAYKIKKPVQLGFLDFSTLERRHHFCEEEVRLNRRLAPTVYLGVVPVTASGASVKVEGSGPAIEWAVKMERLPDDATLQSRLQRGDIGPSQATLVALRVAEFHSTADGGPNVAPYGRFEMVARNARENFEQAMTHQGVTVSHSVFERLRALTEAALVRLKPVIESRAHRGVPRDTHGDLHLDHVYYFPERPPPGDLVIIDCIEFNERFRYADPVADAAFLNMDLIFSGRRDLARVFADAYFQATRDEEGRALLPFYSAYRAAVRGKVGGMKLAETEIPQSERASILARARARWLVALGELETPGRRPCLLLVGGLPGTGKSTVSRDLSKRAGFSLIRSDVVRKELAAVSGPAGGQRDDDIYASAWTERTYAECLRRAEAMLFEGKRVLVDATFRQEKHRTDFFELAVHCGVPAGMLICHAEPEYVRRRLEQRRGDVSDADWDVYLQMARTWEETSAPSHAQRQHIVSTEGTPEAAVARALDVLRILGLYE